MQVLAVFAAVVAAVSAASVRQAAATVDACLYIDAACATEVPVVPTIIDQTCMTMPVDTCTKSPIAILTWSFKITISGSTLTFTRYTDDACTQEEAVVEGEAGTCAGPLAEMSGMQAYAKFTFEAAAADPVATTAVEIATAEPEPTETEAEPVVVETEEPVVVETEEPVVIATEEPVVVETEEPVVIATEEPAVVETVVPVVEPSAVYRRSLPEVEF